MILDKLAILSNNSTDKSAEVNTKLNTICTFLLQIADEGEKAEKYLPTVTVAAKDY